MTAVLLWIVPAAMVPGPALAAVTAPRLRSGKFEITAADRAYWAFQPIRRPPLPPAGAPGADANAIDALVRTRLGEKGLAMNPPAAPRELVRRLSFDLLGLPPSPAEVEAFERDPSEAAWAGLVDRMLASPRYGERWGRHWLDLVRYAESNGYERDGPKPNAWRYRDYVIRSFNADKPYDRFVREQLAGDEFAEDAAAAGTLAPEAWRDAVIATGFFRLHVWDDEPDSTVAAEYDDLDDVMVATGTAFLGLTLGCARCHDHKFDPISQADYYSMLGFFRGIDPYGQHKTGGGGRGVGKIERALALPEEVRAWEAAKQVRVKAAEERLSGAVDAAGKKRCEEDLKRIRSEPPPFGFALAAVENGPVAKPTHVLARGDPGTPRGEVSPAFPAVLGMPAPGIPRRAPDAPSTGRRRVLADWVANPENPLTARVIANRVWQRHFGTGIVPTPDDFGRTGLSPTHPELLDYLASELVGRGWSLKQLHRLILSSRAYRMSSDTRNSRAQGSDPGNALLWRQSLRRIDAEAVRDTLLVLSGELNLREGGPSVYPTLSSEVHGTQDSAGKGWTDSEPAEQRRRSVYLVVKRALKVPLLECLDFANSTSPVGVRPVTTTAPQALTLLNDAFVQQRAAAFAARLSREAGPDPDARIRRAFALALQRAPTPREQVSSRAFVDEQFERARSEKAAVPGDVAWSGFARALLNLNETLHAE